MRLSRRFSDGSDSTTAGAPHDPRLQRQV